MQTKIKSTLVILLIFLTTISCDDFLDKRPENGIIRDEFWRTKEDVQAAVAGIYSSLLISPPVVSIPSGGTDYTISEYLFMFGELRADMLIPGPNVTTDQRDITTSNILPSNDLTSWDAFYRVINYCNTVIDLAPSVLDKDPTLTQTKLNNYLSEALAIRAYMYFTLARTFKDVPLKLTATLTDVDNFQIPTSSQNEVFAQVIKDLTLAEQYAVEDYGDIATNKAFITVYTINAMQTDVYLWMEKYSDAIVAADKVINSNKFSLLPSTDTWNSKVFFEGNSSESIFELQFTTKVKNPFYDMFHNRPEFIAGPRVMEDVFGIDYDDPTNKDVRGEYTSVIPGTNEIIKFTSLDGVNFKASTESDTHWFVYRYSDVMLMKAEALTELGTDNAEVVKIINDIRTIRNAYIGTSQNVDEQSTKSNLINYILAERAREFAYEGKRWFDVLRNAKRNNYARLDILVDMALVNAPADKQQSIIKKLNDYDSHYLPINTYDLYTNKALVQNPFYK